MSFLLEDLRNRRVVRVGVRYVLTTIGLLITMGVIEAWVGMPDWAVRMVAGAAFVGLPFLLVLIWALDSQGPETKARRRVTPLPGVLGATIRTDRIP
jgi:heme A synthase